MQQPLTHLNQTVDLLHITFVFQGQITNVFAVTFEFCPDRPFLVLCDNSQTRVIKIIKFDLRRVS